MSVKKHTLLNFPILRFLPHFSITLILLFFLMTFSSGVTVTITGTSDTDDSTIYSNATADNVGANLSNRAGKTNLGDIRRLLIRFDLSSIPSTATISSVTINMTITNVPSLAGAVDHRFHRILNSWSEGTGLGIGFGSNQGGAGGQIVPGGVTWSHTVYPGTTWINPGGDYSNITSAIQNVGTSSGPISWTSAGLISDIQGWVNNSFPNNGWILIGDESGGQSARGYGASEDSINAPGLVVEYTTSSTTDVNDSWKLYE